MNRAAADGPAESASGPRSPDVARAEVCLVNMPYASLPRPSLALGLLKKILEDGGIRTTVAYANLWFAEKVGIRRYHLCSHQCPTEFLAGEWTFAGAAFGDVRNGKDQEYLRCVVNSNFRVYSYSGAEDKARLRTDLTALRAAATSFIDEAAERVLATGARIVGCTSTFEQHVASLALLKKIRELDPSIVTMMGGANCETDMGRATHECFPWVDYVVSGEADALITDLCHLVLTKGQKLSPRELPPGVLGPAHRNGRSLNILNGKTNVERALFRELNDLPTPDFADYFNQLNGSRVGKTISPGLPLETSRGCWWGAVHHCTFCGLNGSSMKFRSKTPDRVLTEIKDLENRHGISKFETVDNILDMAYFKDFLPRLAADGASRTLFYEVKANLNRGQVALLRQAGVTWIQPGIESLHSEVLRLMDKGVQGWQNVQLLKWAREFGLRMSWAILWGFPGEQDDWYRHMADWIPLLEHLQAPSGLIRLRYDRYSVYHNQAQQLGLKLWPISAMSFVYPIEEKHLDDLAYFFISEGSPDAFRKAGAYVDILQTRPGLARVLKAVREWRGEFLRGLPPILSMEDDGEVMNIFDTRRCAREFRTSLTGLARVICLACDEAPMAGRLQKLLADKCGVQASPSEIEASIKELRERNLLLSIDGRLINLAVKGRLPELPSRRDFPGGFVDETKIDET
jgi:ribosomal peptide maturation radical SAM protein 1